MKKDPVARSDLALVIQAETIAANLPTYATILGLPASDLTVQAADALYLRYTYTQQERYGKIAQNWTTWKNLVRDGGDGTATSAPVHPTAPASVPPAVAPGIVPRMRALIRRIKASASYSVAIGQTLDILGTEEAAPEAVTLQPVLTATLNGGRVVIGWTRGSADGLELYVDRGEGKGFVFLALDTVPDYIDTQALPTTPAVWKYKAMYRQDDQTVGQWSAPVAIGVGG